MGALLNILRASGSVGYYVAAALFVAVLGYAGSLYIENRTLAGQVSALGAQVIALSVERGGLETAVAECDAATQALADKAAAQAAILASGKKRAAAVAQARVAEQGTVAERTAALVQAWGVVP